MVLSRLWTIRVWQNFQFRVPGGVKSIQPHFQFKNWTLRKVRIFFDISGIANSSCFYFHPGRPCCCWINRSFYHILCFFSYLSKLGPARQGPKARAWLFEIFRARPGPEGPTLKNLTFFRKFFFQIFIFFTQNLWICCSFSVWRCFITKKCLLNKN